MPELVTYHFLKAGAELPPVQPGLLAEYWLAAGGLYLRACRTELEVLMLLAKCSLPGLAKLEPYLKLCCPPVPEALLLEILERARQAGSEEGWPVESLFYLGRDNPAGRWWLDFPPQVQSASRVYPLEDGPESSFRRALVELHSHHTMPAFFSTTDDRDEGRSFRLFAVIGRLFEQPQIRVRVGYFGRFWEIPAGLVFDLPSEVKDCVTTDNAWQFDRDLGEEVPLWEDLT